MGYAIWQIIFWIALATWFGGVLFIAVCAPIVFRTVKGNNPILPNVLAVNLEGQHGTLLSGSIVGAMLDHLSRIEVICAAVLIAPMAAHWFVLDIAEQRWLPLMLRCALLLAAAGLAVYNWRVLWPRINVERAAYIDHADEPEIANPAKDRFDALHRESVTLLTIRLFILLGMVMFSANIQPRRDAAPIKTAAGPSLVFHG